MKLSNIIGAIIKGLFIGLLIFVVISLLISAPVAAAAKASTNPITGPVLGIDLGTTYSAVAVYKNGEVIVIPNEMGNRITPSIVSFTDTERLIGDAAKNQISLNPQNTIFSAKRIIGRDFNDPIVQKDRKLLPFNIVKDINSGKAMIEVYYKGERRIFSPEEISAMVLSKMKKIAENYLGEKITNAVITVPAYFNDGQRQATKDAGTIAGLNVLRLINEPTSAAMAYGITNYKNTNKDKYGKDEINIMVYDLGGGTFDVTVMTLDSMNVYEVQSTNGDTHLGGEDFDNRIIDYYSKLVSKKHNIDIKGNSKLLGKLKSEIEKAKRTLSSASQVRIEIDNIGKNIDFSDVLTKAKFENLNNDLFKKTLKPVERVLKDSKLNKNEIDEIVMVGGSTRIPKIQNMLSKYFNGKVISRQINADEAIAYGAAIQGAILNGHIDEDHSTTIMDVTPLSLGIETVGDIMTKIIPKDTKIPTTKTQTFSTYQDNQPAVDIKIYQGERSLASKNMLLGQFQLSDIPPAPKGTPQIEVTFNVDTNGILTVTAKEKSGGHVADLTIDKETSSLTEEEIEKALKEAKQFEEEDNLKAEFVKNKNQFETKVYQIKSKIDNNNIDLDDDVIDDITYACDNAIEWIDNNLNTYEIDELQEQIDIFNDVVDPIFQNTGSYSNDNYDDNDDYDHEDL